MHCTSYLYEKQPKYFFFGAGYRHLPGDVLRVRVRGAAGVRGRQLHLLGRQGQEEEEGEEAKGKCWL